MTILIKEDVLGLSSNAGRSITGDLSATTLARLCPEIEEKSASGPVQNRHPTLGAAFIKTRPVAIFGYSRLMPVTLPLHEMTVPEKLRVMEALWEDLSRNSKALESPKWHEAALKKRKARVAAGRTSYMDWERAKKEIRRRVA